MSIASSADKQIKSGFLNVPPSSWLQTLLNKPWVRKQCVLYPDSRQGVKRLEVFDLLPSLRRREPAGLIIPLTDCLKVAEQRVKDHHFVFSVRTRDSAHVFETASVQELREWVDALQRIAFGELVEPCGAQRMSAPEHLLPDHVDFNQLYGPVEHRSVFSVTIKENETSSALQLRGPHQLEIAADSVRLLASDYTLRFTWHFQHIRRYGKAQETFVLESGRSSETGAGTFVFRTRSAAQLQHQLLQTMSAFEARRRTSGALDTSTGNAAAATVGRPATPPPPPPPTHEPLIQLQEPLQTQTLGRRATTKGGKILKPPRRTKPTGGGGTSRVLVEHEKTASPLPNVVPLAEKQWLYSKSCDFSSLSTEPLYANEAAPGSTDELLYAEPEERQAAWRELGRNTVEHTEHSASSSRRSSALAVELVEDALRPVPSDGGSRSSASYACLQHMAPRTAAAGVGDAAQPAHAQYARLPTAAASRLNSVSGALVPAYVPSSRRDNSNDDSTTARPSLASAASCAIDAENLYENLCCANTSSPSMAVPESELYEDVMPSKKLATAGEAESETVRHVQVNSMEYALVEKPLLRHMQSGPP